jgi:ATP-dependent helicase HrpA
MSFFGDLESRTSTAMQTDRFRLRNMLRAIQRDEEQGRPPDDKLEKLLKLLDESNARREKRQSLVPKLEYDEALPVVARREEIATAIRNHQVVVVCGETGSGKSTQLPKICLEIGRGVSGMIGHTQPRRIAARSIASRLGEELRTSVGQKVGFKIRFTDSTGPSTLVKVMTDGVLLAESQTDRFLDQYDTLIIDEAHERSLNIDFLLGYLHRLLPKRPDLKLIITSATIDATRFAQHFHSSHLAPRDVAPPLQTAQPPPSPLSPRPLAGPPTPAPIIEVSGRTYPVDVLHRPLRSDDGSEEIDTIRGVADAVEEACSLGGGDILVFLPTERDILEASHKLRGRNLPGGSPQIVPLYARLSTAEQNRVFQPHSGRRIVLSTNVAESSLTVPGIRFVVDTGTARISRYSARSKLQRLPIEAISQASADQRKGRCGRVGPGVCIRLFSEEDYLSRERFTSPEIQRTNLASVILQLLSLDLGLIDEFPFLDPPRAESIRDGYKTLFELGAVDENRQLTALGRQIARLPADPRIARMIIEASREHCLADVLIIAAALEVQDPRQRPADRQQEADNAHAQWLDPDSDFLGWLKLWDFLQKLKASTTRGQFRKACEQNFLSELRLREWQDVHRQLLEMVAQFGLKAGQRKWQSRPPTPSGPGQTGQRNPHGKRSILENPAYASIHRSLLSGQLSSIANRGETNEYTAAGGNKFLLWPGSGLINTLTRSVSEGHRQSAGDGPRRPLPNWIMAAEMVETTRRYLRTVARIDPDWIEPLAAHLVTRSYSEPHWDRKAGGAMAYEKVSLLGLTIVPRRRVRYTTVDPRTSRRLFIQHGLVEGDFDTRGDFFRHNQVLLESLEVKAKKTRRRELIVDPQLVYDFYHARLPAAVVDSPTLDKWRKEAEQKNRRILFMTEADLIGTQPTAASPGEYPDLLDLEQMKLPLDYHFEPGAPEDGVTVTVPREGLPQLTEERLEWLVPGLVANKIEALIRALPKAVRRNIGPPPEVAQQVAGKVPFASGPFMNLVAHELGQIAGEPIKPDMFDEERLPLHLKMKVRVIDRGGRTVIEGRDLPTLREHLGQDAAIPPPPKVASQWHRDGLTKWDFGTLPPKVDLTLGGVKLTKFPALLDAGESASLRLLDTANEATNQTRLGALRLFVIAEHRELKTQVRWLPAIEKIRLWAAPLAAKQSIEDQLIDLVGSRAFYPHEIISRNQVPRDADSFEAQRLLGRKNILPAVQEVTKVVHALFEAYYELRLALEQKRLPTWQYALTDLQSQLTALLSDGFLSTTPWEWLQHFPRYLKGMSLRLKKLATNGLPRDKQAHDQVAPRWQAYQERLADHAKRRIDDPELPLVRWMLEELRVSLFAQELGTSTPISPQRLDKQWAKTKP